VPNAQAVLQQPIVSMEGVSRHYGDMAAVDDISLQVNPGTILGVIGPSGSGKTTMIRMLTGTLEPTSGTLTVLGQTPRKFTRHAREKIGYMPQHFVLYEELTASENLSFVAVRPLAARSTLTSTACKSAKSVELWQGRAHAVALVRIKRPLVGRAQLVRRSAACRRDLPGHDQSAYTPRGTTPSGLTR